MTEIAGKTFHPGKLLVPVDFSASSEAALEIARDMARMFGAEVCFLHVVPMLPTWQEDAAIGVSFYPETAALDSARQRARERLDALVDCFHTAGLRAHAEVEVGNDVVGNILLVLNRDRADMLIISTHGMSGWRAIVFGSITEKVLKLATCPVLLLPSPKPAASKAEDHKKSDFEASDFSLAVQAF